MTLRQRASNWLAHLMGRAPGVPTVELPHRDATRVAPEHGPSVARQRSAVDEQARELEALRRQAHTDAVTGLPNRRSFVGRLAAALADDGTPATGLLILRVLQLEGLNLRIGHEATDLLLAAAADVLAAYPKRVPGAFAGRLNGTDFALCLPVSGVAEETAGTLMRALRASPAGAAAGIELVIGGVDGLAGPGASEALAAADEALAEAEAAGPFTIEIHSATDDAPGPLGERAWRRLIEQALTEGRVTLGEVPVRDAAGMPLHLACALRVQIEPGGPFLVAGRWLAMASRGRLLPAVDLAALELAIAATGNDGQPRCVHLSATSLASPGFVGEVQRRLEHAGDAARGIWIAVAEGPSLERSMPRLREAAAAWRRHGVHLGLEHGGASMQSLPRLAAIGLDHLRIGARFLRGAAQEAAVREFASALAALAHGLGWKIIAEDIDDERDLAALWEIGYDGATGVAAGAADAD